MKTTLENLRKDNPSYAFSADNITEADLQKVNNLIELIEQSRTEKPQGLDEIEYTNAFGRYFPNAISGGIRYFDNAFFLCEKGSAYVDIRDDGTLFGSISGGGFTAFDESKLKYIGKREKTFWTFSTKGASAHQGLYFKAEVSCFELNLREEPFKWLTTKDFDCVFVSDLRERFPDTKYRFQAVFENFTMRYFKTEGELDEFLKQRGAIEEPYSRNSQGQRKYWFPKGSFSDYSTHLKRW